MIECKSFSFSINGIPIESVKAIKWDYAPAIESPAVPYRLQWAGALEMDGCAWERFRDVLLYLANLRNPRWLKRRARMRRKKRRGWA